MATQEVLDLRECEMGKPDPICKRITGKELYWQNIVGGSLYIGASPPISNGADIRMVTIGKDHFMTCAYCEKETLMRYDKSKSKGAKMFLDKNVSWNIDMLYISQVFK